MWNVFLISSKLSTWDNDTQSENYLFIKTGKDYGIKFFNKVSEKRNNM